MRGCFIILAKLLGWWHVAGSCVLGGTAAFGAAVGVVVSQVVAAREAERQTLATETVGDGASHPAADLGQLIHVKQHGRGNCYRNGDEGH